jgi:serine/threonine protein kinase
MIGTQVSHYKILAKLGAGGMGGVYLAEDVSRRRKVALKVLPPELDDRRSLRRFEREARVLAALEHPNIVRIYSVEEHRGLRFITMELLSGRTLAEVIPADGFDLRSFHELAAAIVAALAATHEKGVIHRDLKPANVMAMDDGRAKVLDFGLARLKDDTDSTERLTDRGALLGSMPYMSPEQVRGEDIALASDIFSLGILLCQMLTGERPFPGRAWAAAMAILRDPHRPIRELRPDAPAALVAVIDRCLAKDAADRYASAMELSPALAAAREEDGEHDGDGESLRAMAG